MWLTAELLKIVKYSSVNLYADDVQFHFSAPSLFQLKLNLQEDLSAIEQWVLVIKQDEI